MLASNRQKLLDQLVENSIADFDIPVDIHRLVERRYHDVGNWLSDHWGDNPVDGVIYPQGSFRIGTVVQPITPEGEYDIDLVCRRDLAKQSTTQQGLKSDVGQGISSYVASDPEGHPRRNEGKRCWTLLYPGEPFHMDVLPVIPDTDAAPNGILITDRELRLWQHSNPIDYASWFHERMRREFTQLREVLAKQMDVDDVPDWYVKTTLQRSVQALKRHADIYFEPEPDGRPASIIITTLAGLAYTGGEELYEVLVDVTAKMPQLLEQRNGVWWLPNPVQLEENFCDRWQTNPGRDRQFFEWVARAHADFASFGEELGLDRILGKIAKSFGERSAERAGASFGSTTAQARDDSRLGMAAGTGVLGAVTRQPIPRHTFHGDAPGSHT